MVKKNNNEAEAAFDFELDYESELQRKTHQARVIAALEEKLEARKLAYKTDSYTVPIKKVNVYDLYGVTMLFWDTKWDHKRIDPRTPVILGRFKNVIGGPMQYFNARENAIEQIDAVYLDSLKDKIINTHTLRKQFQDQNLCVSFAYSLYATVSDLNCYVSYDFFTEHFEELFVQDEIASRINEYINILDTESAV